MKLTFDNITYNIPKFAQYSDYTHAQLCCCGCGYGVQKDAIVGIAEYTDGRLVLLLECPKCKEKWWYHLSTSTDIMMCDNADIETLREYHELGLLDKFRIN